MGHGGESDAYFKNAILISFRMETLFTPGSQGEHLLLPRGYGELAYLIPVGAFRSPKEISV